MRDHGGRIDDSGRCGVVQMQQLQRCAKSKSQTREKEHLTAKEKEGRAGEEGKG